MLTSTGSDCFSWLVNVNKLKHLSLTRYDKGWVTVFELLQYYTDNTKLNSERERCRRGNL